MLSNCKRWGSWALAFALLAALLVPSFAFAGESTYTITGDVTVTLQSTQDETPVTPQENPADKQTGQTPTNQAAASNTTTSSSNAAKNSTATSTSSAKTGDAIVWLALGVVALGAGAVVAMRASRKVADGPNASCDESVKAPSKGLLAVAATCALAALLSFGQFASHAAYAAEELAGVTCSSKVVVDENGKVVSGNFSIANATVGAVSVKGIQAPDELSGWSAAIPSEAIEADDEYAGEWASADVSSDLVQKLKDNDGELTLKMQATVSATTYTVTFDTGAADCAITDQTVQENATAARPSDNGDYEIDGWYTDEGCTEAFDFATPITCDTTLYAKCSLKGYWLAAAGAQDPTASVVGTKSQVDADLAAIKAGDEAVIEKYRGYASDDSVHLYTRWKGSTKDASGEEQSANAYVEFRMIQVGNHDEEGCSITFQATHLLPEAYIMNESKTDNKDDGSNTGGWAASELRARMQPGGDIYKSFDSEFTDKILTVSKVTSKGDASTELVSSQDKFWLLSYSELAGGELAGFASLEGSQYSYWKEQGIDNTNPQQRYKCLRFLSRAGNSPANLEQNTLRWWERSPLLSTSWTGCFTDVKCSETAGNPTTGTVSSFKLGVALAFCW